MFEYMFFSVISLILFFIFCPRLKSLLVFSSMLVSMIYIIWRFQTIPSQGISSVGGYILFFAELIGFLQFIIFCYISSRSELDEQKSGKYATLPSIDIIIPTYGEPIYILKRTIAATLAMTYEKNKKEIYVCDDGKRLDVKNLCHEFGVHYVVRKNNDYAKSGNINHVLEKTTGELIAVFDADMIPKNNFLLKMVPHFNDRNVGFVQAPQSFYNPDIFQKTFNKKMPSEQDFFMHDVQQRRSYINAAIHVGTNAVFRKSCIEEIGGYPTFSITEDIAVGLMIEANGYKGIYLNEPLVLGLNPTNLKDFLQQRDRWCRGNLQLLKHKNPLMVKGLNLSQKIAYLDGIIYWYTGLLKMVYIIAPSLFLLTGISFIDANVDKLITFFIPYFISQYLVFNSSYSRTRKMYWAHIYETILAPYCAKSCLVHLFGSLNLEFKVTSKDVNTAKTQRYFKEAMPHIILLILALMSLMIGYQKYLHLNLTLPIFLLNFIWILYNAIPSFLLLFIANNPNLNTETNVLIDKKLLHITLLNNSTLLKYKLLSLSDTHIEIEQLSEKTLLVGETITFHLNKQQFTGMIEHSIKGKAMIKIIDSTIEGYCSLLSIYADQLKPYFDLQLETKPYFPTPVLNEEVLSCTISN